MTSIRWGYAVLPVLLLAVVSITVAPGRGLRADPRGHETGSTRRIHLVVAPDGNEARYRVREQLLNIEFPSDAVGVTARPHP